MSSPDTATPRGLLPPGLRRRLEGYFGIHSRFQAAAWFYAKDIWAHLRRGQLDVLFRNRELRDHAFAEFYQAERHNFIAFESTTPVPSLVASAHGVVVDLGPGAGTQLDRFDASRVEHIYGVEPNTAFAPAFADRLRETALGQDGKYTLVSCGVEDGEALARFGLVEGSVDCVVSMQVLVSTVVKHGTTNRERALPLPGLWGLVWPTVFGGCRLDRVTGEAFLGACDWQTVEIETSMEPHDLMPRIWGRLVKPGAA
ncbi:Methyltransferase-like protein 7B [Diaporthe eres]|nr:Methyltransferase-like protein 7B [Diaporthe eres]